MSDLVGNPEDRFSDVAAQIIDHAVFQFQMPYAKGSIPEPGILLQFILYLAFGNEKLLKLECLTDFYERRGLFKYEGMIYIFDPKLAQSAINKLEKGAEEYLKNSPLKENFPDVVK